MTKRRLDVIGITIKHVDDNDEIDLMQTILSKYGFGIIEERGGDLVAANYGSMTPDAVADMDRELIAKVGGHLEILLG